MTHIYTKFKLHDRFFCNYKFTMFQKLHVNFVLYKIKGGEPGRFEKFPLLKKLPITTISSKVYANMCLLVICTHK